MPSNFAPSKKSIFREVAPHKNFHFLSHDSKDIYFFSHSNGGEKYGFFSSSSSIDEEIALKLNNLL